MKNITLSIAEFLAYGILGVLLSIGVGFLIDFLLHKKEFARLREEISDLKKGNLKKASVTTRFHIGYWTDPKDNKRKQIWIPEVILEYEGGHKETFDIEGIAKNQKINFFPFPYTFNEKP